MLKLKPKQQTVVDAFNRPNVDTIVLFGTVGTGKTDIAAHIFISMAHRFPKSYIPVFRQNISTAKKTVIPSYLNMLDMMGFIEGKDYKYNGQEHIIKFPNDSVILFVEADPSKDRDGKKIKGINATANHVDEADELEESMFVHATSRKGRRNAHGQPSVSIITMNPNDSWAKEKYYDAYRNGSLPDNTVAIEFDLTDSWQTTADIEMLKTNPEWWTQRFLYNNWEYSDESTSLFKSRAWAASLTDSLDGGVERYAGYDVARSGVDRSTRGLLYGTTVADIAVVKDKEDRIATDEQANWLISDALESGYGLEKLVVDAVGLGVGVIDGLSKEGYKAVEYMSGAKPDENIKLNEEDDIPLHFDSLRSQMIYLYARGVEQGIIKHYSGCPYLNELKKEAMSHNYEITDKVLRIESKDKIKKRLGSSPDLLDCVVMALYVALNRRSDKFEFSFA